MKSKILAVTALWLSPLSFMQAALESPALPVSVSPKDARIQLIGRFDFLGGHPLCAWPGSAIVVTFRGTDLNLLLRDFGMEDPRDGTVLSNDFLTVRVDDGAATTVSLEKGRERYPVATGFAPGVHTVRASKRTESFCGEVALLGLEISAGGALLDPPRRPERRIEFIGDSITCGYGDEATDPRQPFSPATENNDLAYGAITARRFGAEYVCIAWSGIGAYKNGNGDTKNTMNERYDRTLGNDPTVLWDFRAPEPQVVVINLGTNDFSRGDPGRNYIDAYEKLVKTVRTHYPKSTIFCAMGSMLRGENAAKQKRHLETVIAELKDDKLFFVGLGIQDIVKNGAGANGHPSLKTQAEMADLLMAAIEERTDWKRLPEFTGYR
jgi:lysophospholipase L1-like esterase